MSETDNDIRHIIALNSITGVGLLTLRHLLVHFGSAHDALFAPMTDIEALGANLHGIASAIKNGREEALRMADAQIEKAARYGVSIVQFSDEKNYPHRLSQCPDAPPFLFYKGDVDFETAKVISVVGTRRPTDEGRMIAERIVGDLCSRHPDIIVVSGLAFGIDITAHRAALKAGRPTMAVVAHGLDTIYPAQHRDTASQIALRGGAVVSEFLFGEKPETYNFVSRNRIIAGLSDATLIVESGNKGGSLITVRNAFDYNRQVLAVPGFPGREQSLGCNKVIKRNMAALVENADDIDQALGWDVPSVMRQKASQPSLFAEPENEDERTIVQILRKENGLTASVIVQRSQLPIAKVNVALLNMEFCGLVKALPGNSYRLMI